MPTTIPIKLYEILESKLGKEEAKNIIEIMEKSVDTIAFQKKLEVKDELTKELITKTEFLGEMKSIRQEMQTFRQEMQTIKIELEGKIEQLNQKFNFMIILLIIALTIMNPVAAEIIKNLLKL